MNSLKLVYIVNLIILLVLSFSLSSRASEEKVGTSAASFLKIGIGARASGMGGASCAVADDPTAIYWNPAGLAGIRSRQLTYIHNIWLFETATGFLGFVHPFKNVNLGVGIDYLTMGKETRTTGDDPQGTDEKFGIEDDRAIYFSLSKRMKENLSLGMSIKYLNQKVAEERAAGYGADLGLFYRLSKLNLGLLIQNLGPKMKFVKEEFSLPFNIKGGLSYKGIKNAILAFDVNLPRDNKTSYHLGGEYRIGNVLALRAGYNSKIEEEGLSAGFGVKFKMARFDAQLDAAYVPYGDLGDAYRVSLLTKFGRGKGEEEGEKGERKEKEEAQILALKVTDEGDYTRDRTGLFASWDEVPKTREYQYAIGTSPGEVDILGWTSAGGETRVEVTGLNLADGQTYYVSIKAKKRRFLILPYWQAPGSSDGITVDSTPPGEPVVTDDGDYTTSTKELHFTWSSEDRTSGIKEYLYALGTTPKSADVLDWRSAGSNTELTLTDLNLKNGQIYYLSVKARDNAGNESEIGSSDGIMVDATPPILTTITDEGEYTTDNTSLHFSFDFEDKESGIEEYQYTIGASAGGDDVISWKSTTETEITEQNLNLINGQIYYLTVKARNKAGLWSETGTSNGITIARAPEPELTS